MTSNLSGGPLIKMIDHLFSDFERFADARRYAKFHFMLFGTNSCKEQRNLLPFQLTASNWNINRI
jgi:hypothetical protein